MSTQPINLAVRFALELVALFAVGQFGWSTFGGLWQWVAVAGLPIGFAAIWGIFAVPGDTSRSGNAPIPVSGRLRLLLELALFAAAVAAMAAVGDQMLAGAVGAVVVVHYAVSWDRIQWLWHGRPDPPTHDARA